MLKALEQNSRPMSTKELRYPLRNFSRKKLTFYGVKTPLVGKIAIKYWHEVKSLSKVEIFALCEELYRSGYTEEAFVVSTWLPNMIEQLTPSDLNIFKSWIGNYISNWATCDALCNHKLAIYWKSIQEQLLKLRLGRNPTIDG